MSRYFILCGLLLMSACSTNERSASREMHKREELACADIGIVPQTSAFDQCVGNLDATEWTVANAAAR